jgi:2-furoyl-CoA dehydrogenase large subunit
VADALGREDVTVPLVPAKVFEWIHGEEPPPPARRTGARTGGGLTGEGDAFFPAAPKLVWETLLDPDKMAKAIPGCESLSVAGPNTYRGALRIGVGPVRGLFDAHVRLSDLKEPEAVTLHGQLLGALGSSQGSARITLRPEGDGTRLSYSYEIRLTGKVAAVGGRMLSGAAKALIAQFIGALVKQVGGGGGGNGEAPPRRSMWSSLKDKLRGQS